MPLNQPLLPSMQYDAVVIGAGASGLMCALTAGNRGRKVLVIDHANKIGKKILISGGGRCNYTNMYAEPANYQSKNPHFCKSALARYSQWDFQALVDKHQIPWHEKTLGQLFCNQQSSDIVEMLVEECRKSGVSADVIASCNGQSFRENVLFTHRGLSGPAILQISSYWRSGNIFHQLATGYRHRRLVE